MANLRSRLPRCFFRLMTFIILVSPSLSAFLPLVFLSIGFVSIIIHYLPAGFQALFPLCIGFFYFSFNPLRFPPNPVRQSMENALQRTEEAEVQNLPDESNNPAADEPKGHEIQAKADALPGEQIKPHLPIGGGQRQQEGDDPRNRHKRQIHPKDMGGRAPDHRPHHLQRVVEDCQCKTGHRCEDEPLHLYRKRNFHEDSLPI